MSQTAQDKRQYVADKRAARIAAGKCVTCGDYPPVAGLRRCSLCREKDAPRSQVEEQIEYSAQDHGDYPETLRKVTQFFLDIDENGASMGRAVRETGCRADLIAAAISWLEISDGKDGLPVLRAMHKVPERWTFIDTRCKSLPKSEWPKDAQPARHVPYRGNSYWRLDV